MDDGRLAILAGEMLIHTRAASASYWTLHGIFDRARRAEKHPDNVGVFSHLQTFLMHASMISKFIEPLPPSHRDPPGTRELREWRKVQIGRILTSADTAALADRDARNFLEHLDEYLDLWIAPDFGNFPVLVRRCYQTRADRDADAPEGFWRGVIVMDDMSFHYDRPDGQRKELPLHAVHAAIEAVDYDCASFWGRVFNEPELRL